ncbi:MAG: carboxypeptidase-like regulatory domain-containing protein [Bacteroidia bacterium]
MKTNLTKFILFALVLIGSCSKDENNNDTPINVNTISISVMGQIVNESGQPLSNVQVSLGNKTSTTNNHGIYSLTGVSVSKNRAVIRSSLFGYWDCSKGFVPSTSGLNYCSLTMSTKSVTNNISGVSGGTVNNNGASIIFPANAFVNLAGAAFVGNVKVSVKHLPTTDVNFGSLIPGGDLLALNSAGQERVLLSYGMIGVELFDNSGTAVALAPGVKATIQLPIASTQLSSATATIPLWYFDETTQLWKEEGVATRQGNNYVAEVSHFTWWNCDQPGTGGGVQIKGKVVDCNGNPFVNARIYSLTGGYIQSDSNGDYIGWVWPGIPHSVYATFQGYQNSQTETSPPLVVGQVYTYPDLVIPCLPSGQLNLNIVNCDSLPVNNTVILSNSNGQFFFNSNSGTVNMIIPCGWYNIESHSTNTSYFDSIYVDCTIVTNTTIQLCNPTSFNPTNLGFTIQLANSNIFLSDSITVPISVNPSIPNINVNDLTTLTHNPAIGINMYGVPYAPGVYSDTSMYSIQIKFRMNNTLYSVQPDQSFGSLFYVNMIQTGLPNDTVEFNLSGKVLVMNQTNGLFYTDSITSFHGKFIRP